MFLSRWQSWHEIAIEFAARSPTFDISHRGSHKFSLFRRKAVVAFGCAKFKTSGGCWYETGVVWCSRLPANFWSRYILWCLVKGMFLCDFLNEWSFIICSFIIFSLAWSNKFENAHKALTRSSPQLIRKMSHQSHRNPIMSSKPFPFLE